jgi:serine/threonine protein kinase/signal transduction histidine kinase
MDEFLGNYELLNTIAKSRESDVFLVRRKGSSQPLLLKSIKQSENGAGRIELERRFYHEMEIVASLDHPNIAKPCDTIIEGDAFSILYPYERGDTLARLFEIKAAFPEYDALRIVKQLLNALIYVHGRGLIHSDINPHNIFVTEEKGVQLLDFGFSMTEDEARKVPEGVVVGTFPYLSPEQMGFTGFKIDTRTDLFCIAVILYRMIAGKLPFFMKEESMKELLDATIKREVMAVKHVPKYVNMILLKGLRPAPSERYQTAEGFFHDAAYALDKIKSIHDEHFIAGQKDAVAAINRKRLFIVRENELELLCHGLGQLLANKGRSLLLYGKSGVGKTEIVREFKAHVNDDKFDFISAKSNRFTPNQPYSILRHLVIELLLKIDHLKEPEKGNFREAINTGLIDYSGVLCRIVPELRDWFKTVGEIDVIEKEKEADRVIHALTVLFSLLCKIRKLVVFIDDFQWVDKITFTIIKAVLEQNMPCLLICNFRVGDRDDDLFCFSRDLQSLGFKRIVNVVPFTLEETGELVTMRFGAIKKAEELIAVLFAKTDGVPFVLTEAIRYLVNTSLLAIDAHGWSFNPEDLSVLPVKFDPVSLILEKFNDLSEEEKNFLQLASLIEGKFDCDIIEKLGGLPAQSTLALSARLETMGFIFAQLKGGFVFVHDKIQESISDKIEKDRKTALYERLGNLYLDVCAKEKRRILDAAECFMKSNNLANAMDICFKAATYASETIAFDVALRYYKYTLLMIETGKKAGIQPVVDVIKVNMAVGDVLMLTGANEQALRVFEKLNENETLDELTRLEIKYKIGTVYHNMGEFEKSTPCFIEAVREMGIKFAEKRLSIFLSIVVGGIWQCILTLGIRDILPKKADAISLLKVRILNKLCYSLYFNDMVKGLFVHFKALNIADLLIDSFEKSEAYALHQVPIYQILLKKRSFKYQKKSVKIAEKIHRIDNNAVAQSFGGLTYYYHGEWNNSENILKDSIGNFEKIGDIVGQLPSAEHLWKIYLMRGLFNETIENIDKTIDLCRRTNEKYFIVVSIAALNFVKLIKTGIHDNKEYEEVENRLKRVNSFLFHVEAGGYLLQTDIAIGNFDKAYNRAKKILPLIFKNCVNSEYQVRTHSLLCDLVNRERLNRLKGETKINVSDKQLKKDFIFNVIVLWFSCLSYPAYWGSFYRNVAWFLALHKYKKLAAYFFKKAIKNHHKLDMRYEEACSIRDYAAFLDDFCSRPGEARDAFTKAYELFAWCGSKFDTDRLEARIRPSAPPSTEVIKKETTTIRIKHDDGSTSSSGGNQVRIDALLDISASMTEINDMKTLLKQILSAMMTVTGAQYGRLMMDKNSSMGSIPLAMSFEGKEVAVEQVPVFEELIEKVDRTCTLQYMDDADEQEKAGEDRGHVRSDLCVPLNWRDKYLGYVYLVNDKVGGLFGEGARNSAQILAAQAGILLENAHLMDRYKKLNVNLQQQVNDQIVDIMEKNKKLEEYNLKLLDSERMKELLSGALVHDMKNHVAGIEGNMKLLEMKCPDQKRVQRTAAIVSNACVDIVNLSSNLLDIAKMEEGKLEVNKGLLDMGFLNEMIAKYKNNPILAERGISFEVKPPEKRFEIMADVYLLDRVMQNLFSNAVKYAPLGGKISIGFIPGTKENVISFYSSGTPIPDECKETVFEKYGRLDSNSSAYSKGLGLFFCRLVMSAHGGGIWVETDAAGNYFKMSFDMPKNGSMGKDPNNKDKNGREGKGECSEVK